MSDNTTTAKTSRADYALACRRLVRRGRAATLATALASDGGRPYASLVSVAFDCDASPLMLFSDLSDHTRNLAADRRASLLIEEASHLKNPQTGARATLVGRIANTADERHKKRFLARHPEAAMYAGFGDFHVFRMAVERAHYVGGFGRAVWLKADEVESDAGAAAAIAAAEDAIVAHMNGDHAQALDHYANALLGRSGTGWRMTGIDPDGTDLRLGGRFARLEFAEPVADRQTARQELVRLAREKA
ncbi:MAG: HugZ family protein [Rhodospirillales bacterium]